MDTIITSSSIMGRRPYQEDRFFVGTDIEGYTVLAVFDGHGGEFTSQALVDAIEQEFRNNKLIFDYNPKHAMKVLFTVLHRATQNNITGSTASIVVISPDKEKIIVGVVGDSPVVVKNKGVRWFAPEHNVRTNVAEAQAAIDRGGIIRGGYLFADYSDNSYGIQMSRVLGDAELNKVVLRDPEVFLFEGKPSEGDYILLATDGLVDPGHSQGSTESQLSHLLDVPVDIFKCEAAALTEVAKNSHDNVTVILARFV